jgi:hypothetical protein
MMYFIAATQLGFNIFIALKDFSAATQIRQSKPAKMKIPYRHPTRWQNPEPIKTVTLSQSKGDYPHCILCMNRSPPWFTYPRTNSINQSDV